MDLLSSIDAEFTARSTWMPNIESLDFVNDPVTSGPYQRQNSDQLTQPNAGLYALRLVSKNQVYLEYENHLCDILYTLERMEHINAKDDMEDRILQELARINAMKEVEWSGQRSVRCVEGAVVNTEKFFVTRHPRNETLTAIHVTTLAMYILYRVPRRGVAVLLAGMRSVLNSDASLRYLANEVPMDPRTLLAMYSLDPITCTYICCPSCFSLYPHSVVKTKKRKAPASFDNSEHHSAAASDKLELTAPVHCTYRHVRNGSACGQALFDNVAVNGNTYAHSVPRLKYEAQDLKQWIGRLLSRPAIEEEVSKAFRRPRREYMEDMWDAGHLCKILLKEGERFLPGPASEVRLAFSFSMDGFNPYHMKEAKQTVSSTAIWLILLNLPPHLRYRPDNMFLAGIIPGPKKPSLSNTNHSLKLLVGALLEFFDPGVWYSRTARRDHGCRVRAILVPVVSDMLAARQAGGFASPTATYFCTCCNLKIQDIENLDRHTWPERDVVQQIQLAKRWRDAESLEEQDRLFKNHGIRWSPLLDLPYWNPVLFTAIEPMHLFETGLFQTHCRQVWKIDVSVGDGSRSVGAMVVPRPSEYDMKKWYEIIRAAENLTKLREQLNGRECARDLLWHICNDHNLRRAGNKGQLAGSIVEWRQTVKPDEVRPPSILAADLARPIIPTAPSTPRTDGEGTESHSTHEGSVATDDSVVSTHTLTDDRVPSDDEKRAIDKCIQQLTKSAAPNTVLQAKKVTLQFVCRDYCHMSQEELRRLRTKQQLYSAAAAWVETNVLGPENSAQNTKPPPATSAVLGKDVMEAIWADMALTELPSWVTDAPPNWGTAARGKLSANNWRVICTVHLPITLIRLWGGDDAPEHRKYILENFMDLVCAVQIANLRSISKKEIELYERYIFRYVTNFKLLYKLAKVKPIHHAALHYGDILRGFGPAHTHGGAFYERYIHSMQSKNHNMKFGELESTFMHSSVREANLQALLLDNSDVRSHVGDLVEVYEKICAEDVRGTRLAHMVDVDHVVRQGPNLVYDTRTRLHESSLPDSVSIPFIRFLKRKRQAAGDVSLDSPPGAFPGTATHPDVKFLDKFSLRGVQYSTAKYRTRNSHILFKHHQADAPNVSSQSEPGQIIYIFLHSGVSTTPHTTSPNQPLHPDLYLCVRPYLPLQPELSNMDQMYRRFGFAGGFLCRRELAPLIVIEPSSIISHVAVTPLLIKEHQVLHILPMDRLMQVTLMDAEGISEEGPRS